MPVPLTTTLIGIAAVLTGVNYIAASDVCALALFNQGGVEIAAIRAGGAPDGSA